MIKYTIKRLAQSVLTILIIVSIVFVLMRLLPTDYFFTEDQVMKWTEEQKNEISHRGKALRAMAKWLKENR